MKWSLPGGEMREKIGNYHILWPTLWNPLTFKLTMYYFDRSSHALTYPWTYQLLGPIKSLLCLRQFELCFFSDFQLTLPIDIPSFFCLSKGRVAVTCTGRWLRYNKQKSRIRRHGFESFLYYLRAMYP